MRIVRGWMSAVVAIALLTACGDDDGGGTDAGASDGGAMDGGGDTDGGADAGGDAGGDDGGAGDAGEDAGAAVIATGPSRGSAVAVDEAGSTLAVANEATDDVTLFDLPAVVERARVTVGDEPVSVVFSPDGTTLYVVNRASQNVSVVTGADGASPTVATTVDVGSEPVRGALTPSGGSLYVSNWADGTVSIIDTAARTVSRTVDVGGAPFAVCVTNDGDPDDDDETVFVTDFYSQPIAGQREGTDASRNARVLRLAVSDPTRMGESTLMPMNVTGIAADIDAASTRVFPNQLYACAISGDRIYVTAVGASPEPFSGTTDHRQNVHGLVYALDTADGSLDAGRTVNLSQLVAAQTGEKRFAAVPADLAFEPGSDVAYVALMSADALLRVDFGAMPPAAGSAGGPNFLSTGSSPTGVAVAGTAGYAYNLVGRTVAHLDLAMQTTVDPTIDSAPGPAPGSAEADALRGQRFFNTGLARWSSSAWVACVACHPNGGTDNVTWVFPAGPRQTVDTAATFDRGASTQRILNWTAIFDEVHDFELNTRGVAGGVGAIVSDPGLDVSNRLNFVGAGGVGDPTNGFNVGSVEGFNSRSGVLDDWDHIETYLGTVRSPHGGSRGGDPTAGRSVFMNGGCANCHGGPLWTLSERYYVPVVDGDLRARTFSAEGITSIGSVNPAQTVLDDLGFGTSIIDTDANGPPHRHLCVVRNVGTFSLPGPGARGAQELRQDGGNAQGVDGFNVPSLLGVGMGAPYLHHGAAESLEDLLDPSGAFTTHLRAGNAVFAPNATELADLIAFLRSIDDNTPPLTIPANQRFCPTGVVPP